MTTLAGLVAAPERGEDCDDGIDPGEDVGIGDADLLRLAVGLAGQIHDAAHPLDHEVVAGAMRIRAVLPKTGDRAIDQSWIERAKAVVVEAVALQPTDLEVLDQDIGVRRQPTDKRAPLLRLEIGGDRPFAAIAGVEVRRRKLGFRRSPPRRAAPSRACRRRSPGAPP